MPPVLFVGAGPGDPNLLTLAALRALQQADVVLHDALVSDAILDLIPRGTRRESVGKTGFGPAMPQAQINARLIGLARTGLRVVRLKGGDPSVFGRLDEELDAVEGVGLDWQVVPGITAASAAAASTGRSLTRRGRNAALRVLTGHDIDGFAEQDWRALAAPGAVAAIYMAKRAARFVQGRLMMHGADPATPVTLVENASRPDQRVLPTTLARWATDLGQADPSGPVVTLFGLSPRAAAALSPLATQEIA